MKQLFKTDIGCYRKRRGKLVRIPDRWVGKLTHPERIRNRQSKQTKKIKRYMQAHKSSLGVRYMDLKYGMLDEEK